MSDEFEKDIANILDATRNLRSQYGTDGAHTLQETVAIRSKGLASPASARTPEYWTARAEEARTIAEGMSDPSARFTMEKVAESYDLMALQKWQIPKPAFTGN
jgi:hypothetical protein